MTLRALALLALWLPIATTAQTGPESAEPVVLVHYMPWYQAPPVAPQWGYHWTFNHFNPDNVGADGLREIASHFHPLIGPYDSRAPDVLEYHGLLMRTAGIDGVAVDWYGTSSLYDYPLLDVATKAMFEQTGKAGLQFTVCYEDATLGALVRIGRIQADQAVAQAQADMAAVRDRWAGDARYVTAGGAPVVLNFGPQYLRTSAEWTEALSVFPTTPAFVTEDNRLAPVGAGAFPWPPMSRSVNGVLTPARLDQYLASFYSAAAQWPLAVGGAFTGFYDIYAEAGVGPSYGFLDDRDGLTLTETLQWALDSSAPIIQIATWNDYGEGTMVEPTVERGYRDLETIQAAIRTRKSLPYQPADLELPLQLYRLRADADAATDARLDEAAAQIVAGNPAAARDILDSITSTAADDGPESSRVTVSPNPARGPVTVTLDLPAPAVVRIDVVDTAGRRVARLADGRLGAGHHVIEWPASASGAFLVRTDIDGVVTTRRVTRIR